MKAHLRNSTLCKNFFTAFIVCFSFSITQGFSQAGTLDSSFGVNGKITFYSGNLKSEYGEPLAIQSDGKIVVLSTIDVADNESYFAINKYKTNGTFDSSFGINGVVETYFDTGAYVQALASAVIIQPDNKIIVGGFESHFGTGFDYFVLARYLPDGTLDSTFGKNGKSMQFTDHAKKALYCLSLQQDGKILAGGFSNGYYVIRYKSNGTIDSSFAVNGILRNQNMLSEGVTALIVQSDGKILSGGTGNKDLNTSTYFEIDRILPNGVFDSAFGDDGHVFTGFFNGYNSLYSIATLGDGSIVATGNAINNDSYIGISKYKSNGELDASFGSVGKITTRLDEVFAGANKILPQKDGKLLVIGQGSSENVIIGRFTSTGKVDSTFGINGKASTSFGPDTYSYSGALQANGKIIALSKPYISLARFNNDPLTISIKKNLTTPEGNTGTTPVTFKIILNETSIKRVTVNYTTIDGTAKAGKDYVATSGTIIFRPGETTKRVTVNIIGDNVLEKNERFGLQLSDPKNAIIGTLSTAICTIKNDDASFANNSSNEDDTTINSLKLYPNPAKDILLIEGLNKNATTIISVIDMQGKIILKTTTSNVACSLNVKQLLPGTYFVKLQSENNEIATLRFEVVK